MNIYNDLIEAQAKLKFWKAKELTIRNEILEEMAGPKDEGAVSKTVDGLKITATYKMTRNVDEAVLDSIIDKLTDEELECVKFKPTVVLKNYRKLEDEGKSKLLDAVILKPSQGSVSIKEVKK